MNSEPVVSAANIVDQHGPIAGLSALLVAIFESSLGVWLIISGFDSQAVTALAPGPSRSQ